MNYYTIVVAYDGTDFYGWAPQPGLPTVAQTLQHTFYAIFNQKIDLMGASRTDAGVHALGQIARFKTDLRIDPTMLKKAWNARLPSTIVIRSIEQRQEPYPNLFHAVAYKTYYYHLFLTRPLPFLHRYGAYFQGDFNTEQLYNTLQLFVGTHDFTAFSTGVPIGNNPVCTIHTINLHYFKRFGVYQIAITGNRFLRHMIRRIVGAACLTAQKNTITVTNVAAILNAKNPNHYLPNAPAKGLLLYKIAYKR